MVASELSTEAQQRIYSTLLAAKLSNKSVKAFINTGECEQSCPKIMNIVIE